MFRPVMAIVRFLQRLGSFLYICVCEGAKLNLIVVHIRTLLGAVHV